MKSSRYMKVAALMLLATTSFSQSGQNLKLWFDKPANYWEEALPIGNGRIAAMVFGNPTQERLQINEGTFWAGSPGSNENPKGIADYTKVQQLIFEGKYKEAKEFAQQCLIAH